MPRRSILTERQHSALFDLPTDEASMLLHYTLADDDLEHINARRRPENRIVSGGGKVGHGSGGITLLRAA